LMANRPGWFPAGTLGLLRMGFSATTVTEN